MKPSSCSFLLGSIWLLVGLTSCHHTDPAPAVTPEQATVTVHFTASCPGILPAYVLSAKVNRFHGGIADVNYLNLALKQEQVDESRTFTVDRRAPHATDSLQASVALPGPYAGFTRSPESFVQVDILIDGKVRKTARVDNHTQVLDRSPYPERSVYLRFQDI